MSKLFTRKSTVAIALAITLVGCGSNRPEYKTLADLDPVPVPSQHTPMPEVTLEEVTAQYHAVLELTNDPDIRVKVMRRLAGLQMIKSENEQMSATEQREFYGEAIAMYQAILRDNPNSADNDRLMYQMAKAYELDGRREEAKATLDKIAHKYPESDFQTEVQFRRGEILFSQGDYAGAEAAYAKVVAAGEGSQYFLNAVYMKGWAQFKQNRYRHALKSYTKVLDKLLADTTDIELLPSVNRNMAQDTLRVMSLSFSYLEGPYTIADVYDLWGNRHYEHLLYDGLGQLYLEKERYRDSADTFLEYVKHFPNSDHAPYFSVQAIDVYDKGGFPSLILPAKEAFVANYGIASQYWAERDEARRATVKPYLHTYLGELASYYHAKAQDMKAQSAKKNNKKPIAPETLQASWMTAANWYSGFAQTFPQDKATPGKVYLMAECLYEANDLPGAIDAFEDVAYEYASVEHGADAGYAAILAVDELIDTLQGNDAASWHSHKVVSALRFADTYPQDQRVVPVLASVSEELLQRGKYADAIIVAERVTAWQPAPENELLITAWLVQGHSHFEMQNFLAAEAGYQGALQIMPRRDKRRADVTDRVAASVYKLAEQQMATGDKALAVSTYLRVADVAPGTSIAQTAQYDAGNHLMEMGQWQQAESVLGGWRTANPNHALAASIPAKMAEIYQQQEKWGRAADELAIMAVKDPDENVQRQSLYLSAQLYKKDGDLNNAIGQYRDYANTYPEPFDLATEARFELTGLYETTGDIKKREFWLNKLISSHDKAGSAGTQRSLWLAAWSTSYFADLEYKRFRNAELTLPLKRSLKKKKSAMQKTLDGYEALLNYGVAEFVTQASYRIGEVYVSLGQDLMDSERPRNLDALELEQYELLLEEQAFPFEEKGIAIHEANAQRSWSGNYDNWVQQSFDSLANLLPARYGKQEQVARYGYDIY